MLCCEHQRPVQAGLRECVRGLSADVHADAGAGSAPVLSEQMAVAPPMVSHAARWRTKLLSRIIFFMLYASEMVTASGRPSGMATTMMVTA